MALYRGSNGGGGNSSQRRMANRQEERIADKVQERVLEQFSIAPTISELQSVTKRAVLTRSSVEAYIFFIFGGVYASMSAFGIPVNFYVGCFLAFAVAFSAIHLLWKS